MVSDRSSGLSGGGGDQRPAPRFAYTEKFNELFPYYLSIGMTYEQFWEMDCELVRAYRKAAKIKQDLRNQDAWVQGAYIYSALVRVAPILRAFAKKGTKPEPYMTEPLPIYEKKDPAQRKTVEDKHDEQAKAYMTAFAMGINKKFQEKGGGDNG